ncbi:O-methyltransferase [Thermanaerothrix sp. 4228-RoL]|uniref:O-methyltransferase n=2 Tax=Thermanaerothrix TaxID=1077886 RepID=A0ABU3NJI6_9CHLR|nr:O-methyltransferase [Thermanaerothrix sp. 4228-RoL]MDT8897019.1 O-methyltransferase [Thermanaerothrix sp. 4228-RoL]
MVLRQVREASFDQGLPDIAITPEEGAFLSLLVRLCRARRVLEIGTLVGYSTLWLARALPPDGIVVTVEKSARHAALARQNFERAGLAERILLLEGEAKHLLSKAARLGPFDFVFIDADKEGYPFYYDWALTMVPSGGVIAFHNALWGGSVALPFHGPAIDAIRNFNHMIANDSRVVAHIYPAGDGTLIAVKR